MTRARRTPPSRSTAGWAADQHGQATVELVALLPLLLLTALAAAAVIAAHAAGEQAGQSAEAGAVALLRGDDARAAALRALPDPARRRAAIAVRGRRVTVALRPRLPIHALERPLIARVTADAGAKAASVTAADTQHDGAEAAP
jgi:hypothetical protein